MSEMELCYDIPGSDYNEVIILEKYGDRYGLVLGRRSNRDGKIYQTWCFPQQYVDKKWVASDKARPWRINLGNVKEAAGLIGEIYSQLCQLAGVKPNVKDDDIPF